MAQIVAWNDISFALGGKSINGVKDIEITGSCETEDTESGEKYVKRKNSKPYEIEMTAILDARLGVDVQSMAKKMTEAARCSTSGYFYVGSAKLFPCSFMMVEASIGEIEINPQGVWTHCEVKLKLEQSTPYSGQAASSSSGGGSSGGGSSGGGSSSSKKTSTKSSSTTKSSGNDVDVVSMAAPSTSQAAKSAASAVKTVSSFVSAVKSVSSTVSKVVSSVSSAVKKATSSSSKKK